MTGVEMYQWFVAELKSKIAFVESKFNFEYDSTVTEGVYLGKITPVNANRPVIRADVRPQGVRLHFPVAWGDELSAWLGAPPPSAYRLQSDWVRAPSIGIATADHDPYFTNLTAKVIEKLSR
jgi:hypothetical protein